MISNLVKDIKEIDKAILKFILNGINFPVGICFISLIILISYSTYPTTFTVFYSSLILFRTGLAFAVGFFICGFVVDKLKKQ